MTAVRARRHGTPDVLTLEAVDRPSPEDDQVLARVHAAALDPSDWHRMDGKIPMLRQVYDDPEPTDHALGGDCAGTVVAVGENVTRFIVGDAVFGAAKERSVRTRQSSWGSWVATRHPSRKRRS